MASWRNGSASDSRSEGCVFKSRRGQFFLIYFCAQFISAIFTCVKSLAYVLWKKPFMELKFIRFLTELFNNLRRSNRIVLTIPARFCSSYSLCRCVWLLFSHTVEYQLQYGTQDVGNIFVLYYSIFCAIFSSSAWCWIAWSAMSLSSIRAKWLRGATVARLTPDQKVACWNHVGVNFS